jgi:hypothetical protein
MNDPPITTALAYQAMKLLDLKAIAIVGSRGGPLTYIATYGDDAESKLLSAGWGDVIPAALGLHVGEATEDFRLMEVATLKADLDRVTTERDACIEINISPCSDRDGYYFEVSTGLGGDVFSAETKEAAIALYRKAAGLDKEPT